MRSAEAAVEAALKRLPVVTRARERKRRHRFLRVFMEVLSTLLWLVGLALLVLWCWSAAYGPVYVAEARVNGLALEVRTAVRSWER